MGSLDCNPISSFSPVQLSSSADRSSMRLPTPLTPRAPPPTAPPRVRQPLPPPHIHPSPRPAADRRQTAYALGAATPAGQAQAAIKGVIRIYRIGEEFGGSMVLPCWVLPGQQLSTLTAARRTTHGRIQSHHARCPLNRSRR